jgi:hypothetical protein
LLKKEVSSCLKKYLGINLTKDFKDLKNENYMTLKKEIEEDIRRWKDLPTSGIYRIILLKWSYYQK